VQRDASKGKKLKTHALLIKGEERKMQIHNFYADPVPSIRNPLDSIVLSPHTIKPNDFSLTKMKGDC